MDSTTHNTLKNIILFIVGLLLLGGIIECIALYVNDTYLLPHLPTILKDFFLLFKEKSTYLYIGNTFLTLGKSLIYALIIGTIFGILAGVKKEIYVVLKPIMSMLRCLPVIVLILILVISFGFKKAPVLTTTLVLFPLIYEGVYQGVSHIDKSLIQAYRLETKLNARVIFTIYLPLISSYSKTVFISAIGMGIKVLITAEYMCGVKNTLGRVIQSSWTNINYEAIYPYTLLMILITLLLESIPYLVMYIFGKIRKNKEINNKTGDCSIQDVNSN